MVLKLMAGYSALPDVDLSRRMLAERARRHQPGEHVVCEPAGLAQRITRQQASCLFHRCPVNADAAPRLVRLAHERSVYQRVPRLPHPAVEGYVLRLEDIELSLAQLRRVRGSAEEHDRVGVHFHCATLARC